MPCAWRASRSPETTRSGSGRCFIVVDLVCEAYAYRALLAEESQRIALARLQGGRSTALKHPPSIFLISSSSVPCGAITLQFVYLYTTPQPHLLSERYAQRDKRSVVPHPWHRGRKPPPHRLISGLHDPVLLAWLALMVASRGRTPGCAMETA